MTFHVTHLRPRESRNPLPQDGLTDTRNLVSRQMRRYEVFFVTRSLNFARSYEGRHSRDCSSCSSCYLLQWREITTPKQSRHPNSESRISESKRKCSS